MENALVIYSPDTSARFRYIVDWIFKEQLKLNYSITSNQADVSDIPFFISYGKVFDHVLSIPATDLLQQNNVREHEIAIGTWDNTPTFYSSAETGYTIPFDIFSAAFFLLSRYEEYFTYTPDKHNRYPATQSILYKNNWLERPLLDEWIQQFRNLLRDKYSVNITDPEFSFLPTYDIDMAYAYKGKGIKRTAASLLKQIASGDINSVIRQFNVQVGTGHDPYDNYEWLKQLDSNNGHKPVYFILAATIITDFDKNINPADPVMTALIKYLSNENAIGLHPSYYSDRSETLTEEKKLMESICGKEINISRQHYIRNKLPDVYTQLINAGIITDYSMGYGSHLGFRAGTGQSFLWYDLSIETIQPLRIYPFCFMDTAAKFHAELTLSDAFTKLNAMAGRLKQSNSQLITIFHNSSLGTSAEWFGWKEQYEIFAKSL